MLKNKHKKISQNKKTKQNVKIEIFWDQKRNKSSEQPGGTRKSFVISPKKTKTKYNIYSLVAAKAPKLWDILGQTCVKQYLLIFTIKKGEIWGKRFWEFLTNSWFDATPLGTRSSRNFLPAYRLL